MEQRGGVADARMSAVRLKGGGGAEDVVLETLAVPAAGPGEALVRVHAAGITRGELGWPTDRLPATPSYELSGVIAGAGQGVDGLAVGDAVYALTPFDRDGVAAEYAVIPAALLAPQPRARSHVECAAVPLAALSAWQGLFNHGRLGAGQRVLVHGAGGGVGRFAVQLARWQGAHVIGTASPSGMEGARASGADEVVERTAELVNGVEPVDLVFDTVGGEALAGSQELVRRGGRIVTVAEEAPAGVDALYFVVRPSREQLVEIARLVEEGVIEPAIDSVFALNDARAAFERVERPGKRGKVVIEVIE